MQIKLVAAEKFSMSRNVKNRVRITNSAPSHQHVDLYILNMIGTLKVCPHYAAWHIAAKCGKAMRQKLRHATSISGRCVGLAAACHSMLRGLKIQSANCRSHQKKPRGI